MNEHSAEEVGDAVIVPCVFCGSCNHTTVVPATWNAIYSLCTVCGHQKEQLQSGGVSQDEPYYEDEANFYFSPFSRWLSAKVARQRIRALKSCVPNGHILEVGPGTGEVILAAEREGFLVEGVENSSVFVERLRLKTAAVIHHSLVEDADFRSAAFDAVLSFHVIEHIADPLNHLHQLYKVAKPRGYLLIATPNAASWDRRLCKTSWTGYSIGHVNLFTRRSLSEALTRTGWEVVKISTLEFPWQLLWSLKVRIKPKRNTRESAGSNIKKIPLVIGAFALGLFGFLTKPLRFIQEKLGGGNEVFVVARRSN